MSEALVFNIQRFSTDDGPGIRTTVFFKGCTLRCAWCHNPEGLRRAAELVWHDARCIADHACLDACTRAALSVDEAGISINRERCEACGTCADVCPSVALELLGAPYACGALLDEVRKDEVFFETSGGGVTVSGGEALMQVDFLSEFLPACKSHGLHVALDTCGHVPWSHFERVLASVDLVLFDLKLRDPERHRRATASGNELVLDNARRLSSCGIPLWIRTPIVPGFTDDEDNLRALGEFIRDELSGVARWDLLAYTNLGNPKYHRLGLHPHGPVPLLTEQQMRRVWEVARPYAREVFWSGATRPAGDP